MAGSVVALGSLWAGFLAHRYGVQNAMLFGGSMVVMLFLVARVAFASALRASKAALSAAAE